MAMTSQVATLLLIHATLRLSTGVHFAEGQKYNYRHLPRNPESNLLMDLQRVSGVLDCRTCLVECSTNVSCSGVHCDIGQTACWQEMNNKNWGESWQSQAAIDGKKSFVKLEAASLAAGLAAQLVAWWQFRFSIHNQAVTEVSAAVPSNSTFEFGSGMNLTGSDFSHLDAVVPAGFRSLTGVGGAFAMFVKAERKVKPLVYFWRAANSPETASGFLLEVDRTIAFAHAGLNSTVQFTTEQLTPASDGILTIGVSCQSSFACSAIVNGVHVAMTTSSYGGLTNEHAANLRLGARQGSNEGAALEGRIVCCGFWTRALSGQEMAAVDAAC